MTQPSFVGSRSSAGSRIHVIEDVLLQPSATNSVNVSVCDDVSVAEMKMNVTESDAQYLYGFENG